MSYLEEVIYKISNVSFGTAVVSAIFFIGTFVVMLSMAHDGTEDEKKFYDNVKYYSKNSIYIFIISLIIYILCPCIGE